MTTILGLALTISLEGVGLWALENLLHRWSGAFANGGSFAQAFYGAWVIAGSVAVMGAMFLLLIFYGMLVLEALTWEAK
jgi:hypothetical protein